MAVWLRAGELEVGVVDGIIRREEFAKLTDLVGLTEHAAERLQAAADEAHRVLSEARAQAEQERRMAQADGERIRAEAREQGLREAAEQWAESLASRAFEAHVAVHRASDRLAELVSLAAQRVVEVEDRDGLYRRALRSVKSLVDGTRMLTLHVGSSDAAYARQVAGELAREIGIPVPLDIKVDERLTAGGCVLESDHGVVDASLGLQIEAVKQAIGRAARAALVNLHPEGRAARATEAGERVEAGRAT